MTWGTITEEGIAEAEALIDVPLRRDRMQWIEEATRDAIRHFAWGVGDNNPLWLDREYGNGGAKLGHGSGGIVSLRAE